MTSAMPPCPGCGSRRGYCWHCHRTCARKRLYRDYAAAKEALAAMRERKDVGARLNIYRCPMGDHFHLGNATGRWGRVLDRRAEKQRRKALIGAPSQETAPSEAVNHAH